MVQIILLIIGVTALFKKSISVSKKSELRRPKIITFGIITIVMVILATLANVFVESGGDFELLVYALSVIIPIIVAISLKQPKQITQ